MKKYIVLILCLLSLRGTAQNRYEDLGNGTILVHRDIPATAASSKNMKTNPAQHLHFQGISLNISFQNFLKHLRAKHFYIDIREGSDYCDITGTVCGIPNFDITLLGDWNDGGKIYGVTASKLFPNIESMNAALEGIVDKLTKAYPRYEGTTVTLVDENRNMIDTWSVDVYNVEGTCIGSLYVFAQAPDGVGDCNITIQYEDQLNSLASDARCYNVTAYDIPIDISEYVKPTLDACTMEIANAFLKFTCRKGYNVYEMVALGTDRDDILSSLKSSGTNKELNRKIMNAYFAKNLRVYNGNVMACTNNAFENIHDNVVSASISHQNTHNYEPPTGDIIEFNKKILNSKTNADMGWTILEYLAKQKATRSSSSKKLKYHCNGLEFNNPADMEDYKNAQGLK